VTASLAERLVAGDPRAIARAISLIEDEDPSAADLVRAIFGRTGRAYLIGVTGPPGAGKSTLVDRLITALKQPRSTPSTQSTTKDFSAVSASSAVASSIGVIAVDPTSPFTGGAVLGDRLRMQAHSSDPGVFIRSMATRGHLGGLARATGDAALVLDAAGKDVVIIETVGVGQDEVDIIRTADVSIVTLVPGTGDEVQALKAGIMEIADIFVINKADRDGADRVEREIRAMQSLALRHGDWVPPIVKTVAQDGTGVPQLADTIHQYEDFLFKSELGQRRRIENWRGRLIEMLRDEIMERVRNEHLGDDDATRYAAEVADHKRDPYTIVEEIVGKFSTGK
jgi:LAO/AO transport system kinase